MLQYKGEKTETEVTKLATRKNIQIHYCELSALQAVQMRKYRKYRGEKKGRRQKINKYDSPWPGNPLVQTEKQGP